MTETSNNKSDQNQHITDYLTYYINKEAPVDSAVLLTGSWGCGKTYYIDQFIAKINAEEKQKAENEQQKYIFKMSVFGLKTISDLDNQIGQEIYYSLEPRLGQSARIFSKTLTVAGTVLNCFDVPIKIKQDKLEEASKNLSKKLEKLLFSKNKNNIIFVFDDLERTDIPLKELLGHINAFVERDHIKVILIANEDELTKECIEQENNNSDLKLEDIHNSIILEANQKEAEPIDISKTLTNNSTDFISDNDRLNSEIYKKFKEKVISKTFEIQSNFSIVLDNFLKNHKYKDIILPHINLIKIAYKTNDYNNLRQLKYTLDDFTYLFEKFNKTQQQHYEFIKDLISDFFESKIRIYKQNFENLTSSCGYSRNIWIRFLQKNDYTDIQKITEQLRYFIPKKEQPLWMQLLFYYRLEDKEFNRLSQKLINNFNSLQKEDYYEYFHILGLMIEWSRNGLISENIYEIENTAKNYLNEHSDNWFNDYKEKWQNLQLDSSIDTNFNNKTGYMYPASDAPCFTQIWELFYNKQEETYYKIIKHTLEDDILAAMQEQNNLSLDDIILTKSLSDPIFNQVTVDLFFDTLVRLTNFQLYKLNYVIYSRYLKKTSIAQLLTLELNFWHEVRQKLKVYLNSHSDLLKIKKHNSKILLETIQKIIKVIQPFFIIESLEQEHYSDLEVYLCNKTQETQQIVFDENINSKLRQFFWNGTTNEINRLSSIVVKRYDNLSDIQIVQAELSFWKDILNYLLMDERLKNYIRPIREIIHKIEKTIKDK